MKNILLSYSSMILLFFSLFLSSCKKNNHDVLLLKDPDIQTEQIQSSAGYGVVNVDRLRFRSDNDLHSKTLRYLDKGDIVTILKKDNKRVRIGEMEDYWYQIEYSGIKGWVFGYFLDIFSRYHNAEFAANMYNSSEAYEKQATNLIYEDGINNDLFFLSTGKILQVIDVVNGKAKILKTLSNIHVTDYFFSNKTNIIYYIGKKEDLNSNGNLYFFNMKSGKNELIASNVFEADINLSNNIILILTLQRIKNESFWIIRSMTTENKSKIREISKIKKKKESENLENDPFSKTLQREKGSLANLRLDNNGKVIYFKPPEENQTYLISMSNGEYILIDTEEYNSFDIDDTMSIIIYSEGDESGAGLYSIVLKDKITSKEKNLVRSELYPINFEVSPNKNFLAISMVNISRINNNYYSSSIYVLSLSTHILTAVSTEGNSYQPKWSVHPN